MRIFEGSSKQAGERERRGQYIEKERRQQLDYDSIYDSARVIATPATDGSGGDLSVLGGLSQKFRDSYDESKLDKAESQYLMQPGRRSIPGDPSLLVVVAISLPSTSPGCSHESQKFHANNTRTVAP